MSNEQAVQQVIQPEPDICIGDLIREQGFPEPGLVLSISSTHYTVMWIDGGDPFFELLAVGWDGHEKFIDIISRANSD